MTGDAPIRVAVVGTGASGRQHLESLRQLTAQTYFLRRDNRNALGQPRTWTDNLLWHHAAHSVDLFRQQTGREISVARAVDVLGQDPLRTGAERQDREFVDAIREGREPEASVASVLPSYRVLADLERQLAEGW
jgi:predicted dehydrogenase